MLEDFHQFFKFAQDELEDEQNTDALDETEDLGDDKEATESLKELGFSDTEVDPNQASSSFFFNPQKEEQPTGEQVETTEYKVDDKEKDFLNKVKGYSILLDAHRVDWIIKSAYQSLFLYLRDAIGQSTKKTFTYQIKFLNTPWTEGTVSFDTLSRFNVYYDSFSEAIMKIEPKIEKVNWTPTFQDKDLFLTFEVSVK